DPPSSAVANPSASVVTKSYVEVIARLERQIGEVNLLVSQYKVVSQNQPPDARLKGPMPPMYLTSSVFHQGDHFATFQQTQSASLTNSTQDTPLVYTFDPPKAQIKKKEKEGMMLTTQGTTSYNHQPPPRYPNSQYYICNNQVTFHSPRPMQNP
ncbi:hypothetical protein EJD97_003039, partial [Solanum chilense]